MSQPWIKYLPSYFKKRLDNRLALQNALSNTAWLFADRIVRMGVGLLVSAWVARYLGPKQFGLFSYSMAFVALFSSFANLGLDGIVIRNIVRDPLHKDETLGSALVLKLGGGLTSLSIAVCAISLLRSQDTLVRWMVGIIATGFIFQAFDTIDLWFQSQVKAKYTVLAKNAIFLLVAMFKIILILLHAPLIAFAWAGLAEISLGAFGLIIAYRLNGQYLRRWKVTILRINNLLKDSWPLILSGLSILIYMKIDQVMLGDMVGEVSVGIYAVATKISEVWYFIPVAVVSSVFPSIIQAKSINENVYYQRLQRLFSLMVALALGIAIPMTFFSTNLVVFLFGNVYSSAGPVLAIHIWASLFVFLGVAQSPWDVAENLTKLSMMRTACGALINIVLNLLLIPHYSFIGAAVATVISQAFSAYILNAISKKSRAIFFCQTKSLLFMKYLRI